ncbi:MAG: hypothetical protein AABX99_02405 [Nanoarchaeota archaeon]
MKIEKIGEVNLGKFKTEFKITSKVKKYLEKENISLASLLPDGWKWYEMRLFDEIDKDRDGKPDKKLGKNFVVIYNKITETLGWNQEKGLETSGFEEKVDIKKLITHSSTKLISVKNQKKEFMVGYALIKK